MDIVLVDTSVWINFFKGRETAASLYLYNNLSNIIVATCPVITQEVLQGIVSNTEFKMATLNFEALLKLVEDPYAAAVEAATLYRALRGQGITVRKPNDCLIAIYAIRNQVKLLHDDKDFEYIARHSKLLIQL
jgi:predicted nucleic acid-binding protein